MQKSFQFSLCQLKCKRFCFFFCIFQYIRENALNKWKNNWKHQFENDKERVEKKQFHSTQTNTTKTQTDDEIPQIKERSQKGPKQAV